MFDSRGDERLTVTMTPRRAPLVKTLNTLEWYMERLQSLTTSMFRQVQCLDQTLCNSRVFHRKKTIATRFPVWRGASWSVPVIHVFLNGSVAI